MEFDPDLRKPYLRLHFADLAELAQVRVESVGEERLQQAVRSKIATDHSAKALEFYREAGVEIESEDHDCLLLFPGRAVVAVYIALLLASAANWRVEFWPQIVGSLYP